MIVIYLGTGIGNYRFGISDLGSRVEGMGFGVWGLGFGVWGLGFGVWGLGFGVRGLPSKTCSRFSREEHDGAIMGRIVNPKYMKVSCSPRCAIIAATFCLP